MAFALFPVAMMAQKFTAALNTQRVAVGDRFSVTYKLEAQGDGFQAPTFENFKVLSGPNQSSSMSWVNGQMSSSISYSYILTPVRTGRFTIPPASIQVGGKRLTSNAVSIEVVAGGTSGSQAPPGNSSKGNSGQSGQVKDQAISDNVFIRCIPSRTEVYLGEQILCEYKIYTRLQILDNAVDQLPSFNGFFSQEEDLTQAEMSLRQEVYNGLNFQSATIKRIRLSPQRAGNLPLDKLSMDLVLRIQDNRRARSIFDQFFGAFQDVRYKAVSNPVTIKVKPLPESGKPADFIGAVGKFNMSAEVDRVELNVNDALNLKIVYSGTGDLKLLQAPKMEFPGDFEVYDPKINTDVANGKKTLEYLIIPRAAGEFEIPQISFSYFDPVLGRYNTHRAGPFAVKVNKGKDSDPVASVNRVSKKEVNLLGRDIRYIKTGIPPIKEARKYFFNTPGFYILFLLPYGVLLLAWWMAIRRRRQNADVAGLRQRRAGKEATRRLSKSAILLRENNMADFYEELLNALYTYLSDKFLIPRAEMQREHISRLLAEKGVAAETRLELFDLLDKCEMSRYAPAAGFDAEKMYERASAVLRKIEEGRA
jgi:hypothetical protein